MFVWSSNDPFFNLVLHSTLYEQRLSVPQLKRYFMYNTKSLHMEICIRFMTISSWLKKHFWLNQCTTYSMYNPFCWSRQCCTLRVECTFKSGWIKTQRMSDDIVTLSYGLLPPPGSRSTWVICKKAGLLNRRSTLLFRLCLPGLPAGRLSTVWDWTEPWGEDDEPWIETLEDVREDEPMPRSPASTVEAVACPLYSESPPPGADFLESGDGLKKEVDLFYLR